ncbi:MAG: hypothetical protein JSS02_18960 [Planctomycetes bacterium]|nr:hypothetical protein [Planctomycetota bacterium]
MFDQKLLFRIMLWSLAATAVLGVTAVLTARMDVVGRVTGTAIVTTCAAAILWRSAVRFENNLTSVRLSQTGALAFYLLTIAAIWGEQYSGELWGTAGACLGSLLTAATGWSLRRQKAYVYPGWVASVVSIVCGICWLRGIWTDGYDSRIAATGFSIAMWSSLAALCLIGQGANPYRPWRWIGVVAAAVGLGISEYAIYHSFSEAWVHQGMFVAGSIAFCVIHAVLCTCHDILTTKLPIRRVAIASTIVTAALADAIIIQKQLADQLVIRLTIAAAMVASTSTIATAFLLQRHWKKSQDEPADVCGPVAATEETESSYTSIRVECPECRHSVPLALGDSTCPHCGLRFHIELYRATAAGGHERDNSLAFGHG